jgi:hypothetical protein
VGSGGGAGVVSRAGPEDARFEVKFVATALRYHDLLHWIRMHPVAFRRPFPPRYVNNVYFDTHDLSSFWQVGGAERSKLRLRWYGEVPRSERSVLEVKRRRNRLGWKLRFEAGPLDLEASSWRELMHDLRRRLPPEGALWLDLHPRPVLVNRYERHYFATPDERVRITVDRRQAVYEQRFRSRPNLGSRANMPDTLVVEVKFHRRDGQLGGCVIQGIPVRVSRNSKYAIGVQSMLT